MRQTQHTNIILLLLICLEVLQIRKIEPQNKFQLLLIKLIEKVNKFLIPKLRIRVSPISFLLFATYSILPPKEIRVPSNN